MFRVVDSTLVAIYGKLQTVSLLTVMAYKDNTRTRFFMWLYSIYLFGII
ncbi:MAG: hypothetical protein ACFFA4_14220 [Promethearchaeota archaeon]